MIEVPGLRLKQRVKAGELSVSEALAILQVKAGKGYQETSTYKWLVKRETI